MKKTLAFILIAAMLIASALTLASCNSSSDGTTGSKGTEPTSGTTSGTNGNNNNNNNNSNNNSNNNTNTPSAESDLSKLDVTYASPFSEGKAFVRNGDDYTHLHCIDKTGKILFTLTHPDEDGAIDVIEGFHNGIAALNFNVLSGAWLCNEKGEIIKPDSIDATAFDISETDEFSIDLFKAGYFIAKKTTTDFTGSVDEFAVVDSKLNVVVDFSEDFNNGTTHYNYVYKHYIIDFETGKYMNLKDGTEGSAKTLINNDPDILDHPSDAWGKTFSAGSWDGYYDLINNTKKIDLSEYSETLYDCGDFKDGNAYLVFRTESSEGYKTFFTVMGEDGEFEFEPKEIYVGYDVKYYFDGHYVLYFVNDNEHKLAVIDDEGNLKEIEFESVGNFFLTSIKFSDEGIMFKDENGVQYFDFDLKKFLCS